jgi:hypothetical protein
LGYWIPESNTQKNNLKQQTIRKIALKTKKNNNFKTRNEFTPKKGKFLTPNNPKIALSYSYFRSRQSDNQQPTTDNEQPTTDNCIVVAGLRIIFV